MLDWAVELLQMVTGGQSDLCEERPQNPDQKRTMRREMNSVDEASLGSQQKVNAGAHAASPVTDARAYRQ
jgi:hypothetical protein